MLHVENMPILQRLFRASDQPKLLVHFIVGNSASPTQRNEPGYTGISNSFGSANVSANLKAAVHLSPGSHNASSPVPGAVTGHGVVQTSTITGVSNTGTISASSIGPVMGPKRDKKCTYCGIPFSNLDTLNAHMTHYCSRRPQLSHVSNATVSVTNSNTGTSSTIVPESGNTTTAVSKPSGCSSGTFIFYFIYRCDDNLYHFNVVTVT